MTALAPTPADLARAVDAAVAAVPGVERLFATGARAALPVQMPTEADDDAPRTIVKRKLESWHATVSIETGVEPAGLVAAAAADAAAAVLPEGSEVTVRVARICGNVPAPEVAPAAI